MKIEDILKKYPNIYINKNGVSALSKARPCLSSHINERAEKYADI
jgi:hypothetical protein